MKQKRLLIVGQAPGAPGSHQGRPLEFSPSLTRLAMYSGVAPKEKMYELADFVNLLERYPGRTADGKYDVFPIEEGVMAAQRLRGSLHNYARVILLGAAVRECFERAHTIPKGLGWFEGYEKWRGTKLTIITPSPHPAGTPTFWSDPASLVAGTAFWRRVMEEAVL